MLDPSKPYKEAAKWLFAIGAVLFVRGNVAEAYFVAGESMAPTLQDGELVIASKWSSPQKGDIAIVRHTLEGKSYFLGFGEARMIKRVLGVSGDTVVLDGQTYHVPHGYTFVVGDNRLNSFDSRYFGPVRNEDMIGRVEGTLWRGLR